MRTYRTDFLITALVLGFCSAPYAQDQDEPQDPLCETETAKLPKFIMDALASPHALKGKLVVSRDGTIERSKVVLQREGVPEWTHAIADEKLGKGEDLSYEAEVYGDGTEVYEVSRRVDGKAKKVSIRRDQKVRYVETTVEQSALPEAVSATLGKIVAFKPKDYRQREGDEISEYHIKGAILGVPHRARILADGRLHSLEKQLAAELEIGVGTKAEPAAK